MFELKHSPEYMASQIRQLELRMDAHLRAINGALNCIYDLALKAGDDDLKDEVKIITESLSKQLGDI